MTSASPATAPTFKDVYPPTLASVGWFVAPFTTMGFISRLTGAILAANGGYDQDALEAELQCVYGPVQLAAMVTQRYRQAHVIGAYAVSIEEAAESHVLGLDHVAVAGLIPVIEGAGRRLAGERGITTRKVKSMFRALIDACKTQVITRKMGTVEEVVAMLDSFAGFANDYLYEQSERYPLSDKTNRPGITHGAYADSDYGRPLNFFKTIAAIDFLTFVSTFTTGGSWFAPSPTPRSLGMAQAWLTQREARTLRCGETMPAEFARQLAALRKFRGWIERFPIDAAVPWDGRISLTP